MGLWCVYHVVYPPLALLDPQPAPLLLRHQLSFGDQFCQVLRQHDVSAERASEMKCVGAMSTKIISRGISTHLYSKVSS